MQVAKNVPIIFIKIFESLFLQTSIILVGGVIQKLFYGIEKLKFRPDDRYFFSKRLNKNNWKKITEKICSEFLHKNFMFLFKSFFINQVLNETSKTSCLDSKMKLLCPHSLKNSKFSYNERSSIALLAQNKTKSKNYQTSFSQHSDIFWNFLMSFISRLNRFHYDILLR